MNIHALLVPTFVQMLNGLAAQLNKTSAYAVAQRLEPAALTSTALPHTPFNATPGYR
jgi:hypothetical protein